jgi:hypothetical protein
MLNAEGLMLNAENANTNPRFGYCILHSCACFELSIARFAFA